MDNQIKTDFLQKIENALDTIRPHLELDGGNVAVVDLTDDMIVQIKWMGNCSACSMSSMTMRTGIEETLKNKVPEVKGVIALNGVGV